MRIRKMPVAAATVLLFGCGTPTEAPEFVLAELDVSSELMPNPQVIAIGSLQARVRMETVASDCSEEHETRVFERHGSHIVAPYVQQPRRCSSRGARIFLHETVLTFAGPGTKTVVIRTLGESGGPVETEASVDVAR